MGQAPDDRHALSSGDQVQAEPPEEPGVAGAVPVAGVPGQVRAPHGLPAGGTRQRGGIDQAQQVMPGGGVAGQAIYMFDRFGWDPNASQLASDINRLYEHW
jgi:hypothetical protein